MKRKVFTSLTLVLLFFALLSPQLLMGHSMDQSYIYLRIYKDRVEGRFEYNIGDLNKILGSNFKTGVSKEDLTPYLPQIKSYIKERTSFSAGNDQYDIVFTEHSILPVEDVNDFVLLYFDLEGMEEPPDALDISYNGPFDQDKNHRGWLMIEYNWKAGIYDNEGIVSLIFGPGDTDQVLDLTGFSVFNGFIAMVKQGIEHIWIGIDHILFLLALILPSVMRRRRPEDEPPSSTRSGFFARAEQGWIPVPKFRPAFIYIVSIVTLFTIAHTITLSLAALQIVDLPSRLVESIIAISIALAAWHNIKPLFKNEVFVLTFGFGLFHGFGFASVLGEIGLTGEYMGWSLFGFNLGVEIGQIVIVALVFPVLFLIRNFKWYPKFLIFGSIFLILISLQWFVERAFLVVFPFMQWAKALIDKILGIFG